jgi:hypothetical protein
MVDRLADKDVTRKAQHRNTASICRDFWYSHLPLVNTRWTSPKSAATHEVTPLAGNGLDIEVGRFLERQHAEAVPYSAAGVRGNASDSSAMRRDESPYDSYQYFSDAP